MAGRDRRADILDNNPFPESRNRIHRVHAHRASDGTIHVDAKTNTNSLFSQIMGLHSQQPAKHHTGKLWHFSDVEKQHLLLATAAFTLALGFMITGGLWHENFGTTTWVVQLLLTMPVMLLAVGPAFLLHEIGHKIVAKKNGCWAEFRADPKGLRFGIFISFFLGVLFMAPGAVMVAGLVTRRQNGHIAIAGPLVNLGLFVIGIPIWALILGLSGAYDYVGTGGDYGNYLVDGSLIWQQMLVDAGIFWLSANIILGLFNMIPWGPLDGLKVKDWSENAFYITISIFAFLVISWVFLQLWSPKNLLYYLANIF